MKRICSYCRERLPDKPPLEDQRVSHGLCDPCGRHLKRVWSSRAASHDLDSRPGPCALFTSEGRLVALNEPMSDLLSQPRTSLFGLLAGEALRCRNASRPQGCGRTPYCSRCSVRRALTDCAARGRGSASVALLHTEHGPVPMRVQTSPRDALVLLEVEVLGGRAYANAPPTGSEARL